MEGVIVVVGVVWLPVGGNCGCWCSVVTSRGLL